MDLTGKKFAISYSSGKDSALALYKAIQLGMHPHCLITTYNVSMGRSWFHGVPETVLSAVSDALGIPILAVKTNGKDYRQKFVDVLKGLKQQGVEVCAFGDIDISEHIDWCVDMCEEAGVQAYFPLRQESRMDVVNDVVQLGFTATITVVDTTRLSTRFLGTELNNMSLTSIGCAGVDICGENGEYHTFVSDGPIFRHPVPVRFGMPLQLNTTAVLPVGLI